MCTAATYQTKDFYFGRKLDYDVSPNVRLVESSDFAADNFTFFKGFISGMYASNYDLTHVFIDSLCKIIPSEPDSPEVAPLQLVLRAKPIPWQWKRLPRPTLPSKTAS